MHGTVHSDFADLAEIFRRQLERGRAGGAALCVYHRGQQVVDVWGGVRDENGRPWQEDTLALSLLHHQGRRRRRCSTCSSTAACSTTRSPVAHYWPEFAARRKGRYHRAPGALPRGRPLRHPQDGRSRAAYARLGLHGGGAWPRRPRCHAPGRRTATTGLPTAGWSASSSQRVTGQAASASCSPSEIAGPLGLDGLYIGVPADAAAAPLAADSRRQATATPAATERSICADRARQPAGCARSACACDLRRSSRR